MKLLTGLFRAARKRTLTTDNDMGMFREKLSELVEKKAELPDEEVAKRVDELKEMTADLPESEDKSKLDLYLEDIKSIKEQDDATAKEAASMVSDLFEKLDTEAMKEVDGGAEATEEATEEVAAEAEAPLVESEAAPEATEEATEAVEETVAPEEEEGKTLIQTQIIAWKKSTSLSRSEWQKTPHAQKTAQRKSKKKKRKTRKKKS